MIIGFVGFMDNMKEHMQVDVGKYKTMVEQWEATGSNGIIRGECKCKCKCNVMF